MGRQSTATTALVSSMVATLERIIVRSNVVIKERKIMYTEIIEALFIVIPFVSVPFLMFVWER
jgi:hypothetical protein